jgi:NAD(P)H dehydrogenase (quinone)
MAPMRTLVVQSHPSEVSYGARVREAAVRGLRAAGDEVDVLALGPLGFRAAMSAEERAAYHSSEPILDPMVAEHAALVRRAEHLVFVYPTWWSGLPAQLKGWLDRVLVPGVAFSIDPLTQRVRPGLAELRHITGVSTYGGRRPATFLVADGGRRTLTRTLRLSCEHRLVRTRWLAQRRMDDAGEAEKEAFLAKVERRVAR